MRLLNTQGRSVSSSSSTYKTRVSAVLLNRSPKFVACKVLRPFLAFCLTRESARRCPLILYSSSPLGSLFLDAYLSFLLPANSWVLPSSAVQLALAKRSNALRVVTAMLILIDRHDARALLRVFLCYPTAFYEFREGASF